MRQRGTYEGRLLARHPMVLDVVPNANRFRGRCLGRGPEKVQLVAFRKPPRVVEGAVFNVRVDAHGVGLRALSVPRRVALPEPFPELIAVDVYTIHQAAVPVDGELAAHLPISSPMR